MVYMYKNQKNFDCERLRFVDNVLNRKHDWVVSCCIRVSLIYGNKDLNQSNLPVYIYSETSRKPPPPPSDHSSNSKITTVGTFRKRPPPPRSKRPLFQ